MMMRRPSWRTTYGRSPAVTPVHHIRSEEVEMMHSQSCHSHEGHSHGATDASENDLQNMLVGNAVLSPIGQYGTFFHGIRGCCPFVFFMTYFSYC